MRKLWVVFAKDYDGVIVYLKVVKRKSTAKRYLKECQQFFGEKCQMKLVSSTPSMRLRRNLMLLDVILQLHKYKS